MFSVQQRFGADGEWITILTTDDHSKACEEASWQYQVTRRMYGPQRARTTRVFSNRTKQPTWHFGPNVW
jgi:hypothetical protein